MNDNKVIEFVIQDNNEHFITADGERVSSSLTKAARFSTFGDAHSESLKFSKRETAATPAVARPIEVSLKLID
jgi:hypothetical protein